jgi:hypothetical protein
MINSDGGSTDGTPELIRAASFTDADVVQTSHSLRTLHRVVAPYHGLPGKHTALRALFAAVGHPRDGVLVTQLVRPLVRAVYGVGLDEPLGAEFACSGRFASHCLDQAIWEHEAARFAIDLWLRTEAVADKFVVGQLWRPASTASGARATLRDAVQQVVLAMIESLQAHDSFWTAANGVAPLRTWGTDPKETPDAPAWDYEALAEQARHDIGEISPLLGEVLDGDMLARIVHGVAAPVLALDDELWVRIVYAFAAAARQGRTSREHLAAMFVPLYFWRAAAFMAQTAHEDCGVVQSRLDSLCETFERLKPVLVSSWLDGAEHDRKAEV